MAGLPLVPLTQANQRTKLVLLGADHRSKPKSFLSPAAVQLTEVYEFTLLSIPPEQGGPRTLPGFQHFKLSYACMLAEVGMLDRALDYVEQVMEAGHTTPNPQKTTGCNQCSLQ